MGYIKMDGVSFNTDAILSYPSEKEFINDFDSKVYQARDQKIRRELLKQVYKIAKGSSNESTIKGKDNE